MCLHESIDVTEERDGVVCWDCDMEFVPKEQADALAAGVKSFIKGFGFVAPEALALHVQANLAEPLAAYREIEGTVPS